MMYMQDTNSLFTNVSRIIYANTNDTIYIGLKQTIKQFTVDIIRPFHYRCDCVHAPKNSNYASIYALRALRQSENTARVHWIGYIQTNLPKPNSALY